MLERKRKRESQMADNTYCNCDFILGSAAEVERLWSHAELIMRDNRRHISPILFEALLFLKVNRRFWGASLVEEAHGAIKEESRRSKLHERYCEVNNIPEEGD